MRKVIVSRIGKYIIAWLAAVVITVTAMAPSLPAKAASNEDTAFFYLTDTLGFSVAAACGIMANIRHESNFHPGAGSWGGAYGLCQWMGGRLDGLEYYCWDHGFDPESLTGQLSYLTHELKSYYPSTYRYLMNVDNSSDGAYKAAMRLGSAYQHGGLGLEESKDKAEKWYRAALRIASTDEQEGRSDTERHR